MAYEPPPSLLSGWLRNRTGTGNRNGRNRFSRNRNRNRRNGYRFPGTETGTGTVLSCETVLKHRKTFFAEEPNRNRKPERLQPFHPQTVAEPNRTGAFLFYRNPPTGAGKKVPRAKIVEKLFDTF